jgi:hypothetical protein
VYSGGSSVGGGGTGGGGAGGSTGTNGTVNTGGGGGGSNRSAGNGGSGGKGIVIIRYPSYFRDAKTTTGSPTFTNSNGIKQYIFTASGTIEF